MIRSILVGACVLLLLAAPSTPAARVGSDLADRDVREAIEGELLGDGIVPFHSIDVSVDDGIVTLGGTVDTILARKRAVALARATKGVRAVVDRLVVREPKIGRSSS